MKRKITIPPLSTKVAEKTRYAIYLYLREKGFDREYVAWRLHRLLCLQAILARPNYLFQLMRLLAWVAACAAVSMPIYRTDPLAASIPIALFAWGYINSFPRQRLLHAGRLILAYAMLRERACTRLGINEETLMGTNFEDVMRIEEAAFLKDPRGFKDQRNPIPSFVVDFRAPLYGLQIEDAKHFAVCQARAEAECVPPFESRRRDRFYRWSNSPELDGQDAKRDENAAGCGVSSALKGESGPAHSAREEALP